MSQIKKVVLKIAKENPEFRRALIAELQKKSWWRADLGTPQGLKETLSWMTTRFNPDPHTDSDPRKYRPAVMPFRRYQKAVEAALVPWVTENIDKLNIPAMQALPAKTRLTGETPGVIAWWIAQQGFLLEEFLMGESSYSMTNKLFRGGLWTSLMRALMPTKNFGRAFRKALRPAWGSSGFVGDGDAGVWDTEPELKPGYGTE